jgi:hypothetical protein
MTNTNSNQSDEKVTLTEFAALLVLGTVKSLKNIDAYKEIFTDTSDDLLKQEIVAFDVFLMFLSTSGHYRDNPKGPELFQTYLAQLEQALVEGKVFNDLASCDGFMKVRIMAYKKKWESQESDNPLIDLTSLASKNFGKQVVSSAVFLASIFSDKAKANAIFIREMEEKFLKD